MKKENYNMKTKAVKRCREDVIFDTVIFIVLTLILFIVAYPLYWVIISSFSDPTAVSAGKVLLRPMGFTLKGYVEVFKNSQVMRGFFNSIVITFVGVCVKPGSHPFPPLMRFPVTISPERNRSLYFYMITMFFGGGMIPTYLVVKNMQLLNTIWALVLPGCLSVYNMIVARTFFKSNISEELYEAGEIDGCTQSRFFFQIALPLSKAIIAIMVLYYGVGPLEQLFLSSALYFRSG